MKRKPPRPTVVEKLQAKRALPAWSDRDVANLAFAARRALAQLQGQDLINVTMSLALVEAVFAQRQSAAKAPAPAPAPDADADADAAQPATPDAAT